MIFVCVCDREDIRYFTLLLLLDICLFVCLFNFLFVVFFHTF